MFRHHVPLYTICFTKGFLAKGTEPTFVNSSGAESRLRKRKNEHLYRFSCHKIPLFSSNTTTTATTTFLLFSLHHHHHRQHISTVFFPPPPPLPPPPHFYCFPSTSAKFLFFSPPSPPPPHFYCFPSTITTTTTFPLFSSTTITATTFLLFSLHHHNHLVSIFSLHEIL